MLEVGNGLLEAVGERRGNHHRGDERCRQKGGREHGVYPLDLDKWRASCTNALAYPEDARASPQATRADRKRIKALERDLLSKDRTLAETAALVVLSKKVAAIFNKGEDE